VAMLEASLSSTTSAVGPQPPAAEKTSGEKQPISTSRMHSLLISPLLFVAYYGENKMKRWMNSKKA